MVNKQNLFVATHYIGLPASAEYLVKARPTSAVPGIDGDETVVYHRIK